MLTVSKKIINQTNVRSQEKYTSFSYQICYECEKKGDGLQRLLAIESEEKERQSSERRTKNAGISVVKTLDTFEWDEKRLALSEKGI